MRVLAGAMLLVTASAASLHAQSSQFGVRGLGLPGRGLSAAALATQGADGLFDARSSRNPAALGLLRSSALVFTSTQAWRTSENPGGSGSTREQRFPLVVAAGPIPRAPLAVESSYSRYAVSGLTIVAERVGARRGTSVAGRERLGCNGGINDLRLAGAWQPTSLLTVGAGVHLITGSNRVFSARSWADTSYLPIRQTTELTYAGFGLSAGAVLRPTSRLTLAGTIRHDGSLDVERDSTAVGAIDLPWTLSGAARLQVGQRLAVSAMIATQNWAVAHDGLVALGGAGARNTIEVAGGIELVRNARRPEHLPLRLGVRHTELPFLLAEGSQPRELGVSVGTAFRFARDLGGADITLERLRRTQGSEYTETAWHLSVGFSMQGVIPSP